MHPSLQIKTKSWQWHHYGPGSKHRSKIIPKEQHLIKVVEALVEDEECPSPPVIGKVDTNMKFHHALNTTMMWLDSHIE